MCQLTFINSNDENLNKILLVNQYLINTSTTHRDGWGFFTKKSGVFKTELHPWQTANLGLATSNRIKNSEPILAHVRLATATNKIKEVCEENSHPFETKDFVVAHNGSFDGDILAEERFKDKIDSEIFTLLLQEAYDKNPKLSIVKLIEKAYEDLTGKFAFLIYAKRSDKFYIVRGKTANLHKANISLEGKIVGFMVNTDKTDLVKAFSLATQNYQISYGKEYEIDTPVLLEENTVYQVFDSYLKIIGNVEEKTKPVATVVTPVNYQNQAYYNQGYFNNINPTGFSSTKTDEEFLINLYDAHGLNIEEIDLLFLEIVGMPIISATKEEFKIFKEMLEPFLAENNDHKRSLWKHITNRTFNTLESYKIFNLQFPYFVNSISDLNGTWIREKARRNREEKEAPFC